MRQDKRGGRRVENKERDPTRRERESERVREEEYRRGKWEDEDVLCRIRRFMSDAFTRLEYSASCNKCNKYLSMTRPTNNPFERRRNRRQETKENKEKMLMKQKQRKKM